MKKQKKPQTSSTKRKAPEQLPDLEHIDDNELSEKITPINPLYKNRSWLKKLLTRYKESSKMSKAFAINMELANGFHRTFLVVEDKKRGFKYNKRKYIFDEDCLYFNVDMKMYGYDYHELFSLPIKRTVPINAMKRSLELSKNVKVEYAANPSTLERFVTAEIAEGIMRGQAISNIIKTLRLISFIILLVCVVHLLLYMQKTGMLAQLPGIGG